MKTICNALRALLDNVGWQHPYKRLIVEAVTFYNWPFVLLGEKGMKGILKHTLKKVTLELIYQVVDERTTELIQKIDEVKKKQEDDFRYLVQKIDADVGQVRNEISQLNQRIDTIIQMLMTIKQGQK